MHIHQAPPARAKHVVEARAQPLDLGRRPRELTTQDAGIPANGALVLPNNAEAAQLFETHRFLGYSLARHGYALLVQNGAWKIWTRCAAA